MESKRCMSDLAYVDIPEFDSSVAMQRLAKRAIAFILNLLLKLYASLIVEGNKQPFMPLNKPH
jgi:hypothetical protein